MMKVIERVKSLLNSCCGKALKKCGFVLDMKRRNKFLTFFILLFVAVYFCMPSMEAVVKKVVNKYGSEITGTNVSLSGFDLQLTNGSGLVKGVRIANPKGYKSKNLFYLNELAVKVDIRSITKDTIVIESIVIDNPEITYEMKTLTESNVTDVLHNVEKNTAAPSAEAKTEKPAKTQKTSSAAKEGGKKVVIRKLAVTNGKINALIGAGSVKAPLVVSLPAIEMKNIGEEKQGASVADALNRVIKEILKTASNAVASAQLNELRDASAKELKKLQKSADENLDKLKTQGKDAAKNLKNNLGSLFK